MKVFLKVSGLLWLAAVVSGCGHPRTLSSDYFGGVLTISRDTVRFHDCATGNVYRVVATEAYPEVVQDYEALQSHPGESLYMTCRARLETGDDSLQREIVVEGQIFFNRKERCPANGLLVGLYRAEEHRGQVLQLKRDYTYRRTLFTGHGEENQTGRWGLSGESELVLNPSDGILKQDRFEIIYSNETLVANDGDGTLLLQKVYL